MDDKHIAGCLIGTAVGDALGLPYEGVSRQRLPRLLGLPERHRFFFGCGMVSDDTEHTCFVTQSLIREGNDVNAFTLDLAGRLRWWFASFPAGLGRATLKSCFRLWLGVPPQRSGVFSAGNGPAMRSAIFGAFFDDIDTMVAFVRASARITHSDPKAEFGAIAVALATHIGRHEINVDGKLFLQQLAKIIGHEGEELTSLLRAAVESVASGQTTLDFASSIGCHRGVSGYTYHTVPVAIHAWLSNPRDFSGAVTSVIRCGGDADTTAAIVGGIVGTAVGDTGIPSHWISKIIEWPRSVGWMRRLSAQLVNCRSSATPLKPVSVNFFAVLARNLLFLTVVLFHGLRRLLPPY